MIYIGIDVAKNTHCFSVMSHVGEVLVKPKFFSNDHDGFNEFLSFIDTFKSVDHIVGLEATGHYSDNLITFLLAHEFNVGLINPLSTDAERKKKIRKTKNDKIDTSIIIKVLMSRDYSPVSIEKESFKEIRELTRYLNTLKEDINQEKCRLQKSIDIVYPEYNGLFGTKYSKMYMIILKAFPSAALIAKAHLNKIKSVVDIKYRGKRISFTAKELKEHASKSVGKKSEVEEIKILNRIQIIESLEEQISIIEKKIEEYAKSIDSPITSIPGISYCTGMAILSEIGDINNFASASKLIAYAGVDPGTYQSGEYNASRTALSKRGSRYLRKALYQVALTVVNFNPVFQSYYNLKRSEGKTHRCAQGHVVRKLLRIIHFLLRENVTFNPNALR